MTVHRINLKGPWEYEWVEGVLAADVTNTGRVKMPADWQAFFGPVAGTVRFRRRFHRPTNLDADERVWIAFGGVGGTGTVDMNGTRLGAIESSLEPQRFDVTSLLQPNCELFVELRFIPDEQPSQPGGLYAPVAIEIGTLPVCD